MNNIQRVPDENQLSALLEIEEIDTQGLAEGFTLRGHKHEIEAEEGSREARADRAKLIGRLTVAGC